MQHRDGLLTACWRCFTSSGFGSSSTHSSRFAVPPMAIPASSRH
jgi:hypothetical protein